MGVKDCSSNESILGFPPDMESKGDLLLMKRLVVSITQEQEGVIGVFPRLVPSPIYRVVHDQLPVPDTTMFACHLPLPQDLAALNLPLRACPELV